MKHLIIGYGVMGKKYERILTDLGDMVDVCDIEFNPDRTEWSAYDSVLICTPPETHAKLIYAVSDFFFKGKIFCEKPLVTYLEEDINTVTDDITSMVSCPWRYCTCVNWVQLENIKCFYSARDKGPRLDLIHFVDVVWEKYGIPKVAYFAQKRKRNFLNVNGRTFNLVFTKKKQKTVYKAYDEASREIHKTECSMFFDMMKDWRKVVSGKIKSPNDFRKAEFRTKWLMEIMKKPFLSGRLRDALL